MRRKFQFVWAVTLSLACLAYTQPTSTEQLRQAVSELLEGRIAILRVYPDPANDPAGFEKVRAPITNLAIGSVAIKAAYPAVSGRAFVVLMATDQRDEAVATALGSRVEKGSFSDKLTLSLHLDPIDPNWNPMYTFFDAQGEPMPGAAIEIWTYTPDPQVNILLARTSLDERSHLPRLSPAGRFFFHVSHPNYGTGRVQLRQARENPSGIWLVPLVPLDSQAVASSIQGTVVDTEGRLVPDARVLCTKVLDPDHSLIESEPGFLFGAITDEEGWFSLCVPIVAKDLVLKGLPDPGSSYVIDIEPPKQLNLRRYGLGRSRDIPVGTQSTFTLTPMEATKVFHTFSFEYYEGPVTDPQELDSIELKLYRDNQQCAHLTYDQLKGGHALPPGTLRATTTRWGRPFSFQDVELRPDSPEHLVIRGTAPVLYHGRVVDDSTDEPIRGAIIWGGRPSKDQESSVLTSERWQELLTMVAKEADDGSAELLYRASDRVAATEGDGTFEIPFLPGIDPHIYGFTVAKPGYEQVGVSATSPSLYERYTCTIRLTPIGRSDYSPVFMFEDENGLPVDPSEFREAQLIFTAVGDYASIAPLRPFLEKHRFKAGIYHVSALRDGKYYVYSPVDLTAARPETVVFVPAHVWQKQLVCRGQVIHGITGKPIPRAVVIHCPMAPRYDTSSLQPSQWEAVERLGPNPDPKNPAMGPVFARYDPPRPIVTACAITDEDGRYEIAVELSKPNPPDSLLAMARDFLDSWHTLTRLVPAPDESIRHRRESLVPDAEGITQLDPISLFPGGIAVLQPIAPSLGPAGADGTIEFRWIVCEEPRPSWVEQLWPPFGTIAATMTYRQRWLLPNLSQTIYVPAGLDLRLIVAPRSQDSHPPVDLGYFRVEQGQVIKLGRVEFPPGVEVRVCVVDEQGHPLGGITVFCFDEDEMMPQRKRPTDDAGMTTIHVAAHSRGLFLVQAYDQQSRETLEESIPYEVGGEEDAGRQFTLTVSREMATALAEQARR